MNIRHQNKISDLGKAIIIARECIKKYDNQKKERKREEREEQKRDENFIKKGALKLKKILIELKQNDYFKEFLSYVDIVELYGWRGHGVGESLDYESIIFRNKNNLTNTILKSRHGKSIKKSSNLDDITGTLPIFSKYIGDNTYTEKDISNILAEIMKNVSWRGQTIQEDLHDWKYSTTIGSCYEC